MKTPALIEPLTKRELEILSLLESGESNSEIAARLNLSLNSVKWYARQIYGKLGVENRRQAVMAAKELGILSSKHDIANQISLTRPLHNLPIRLSSFIGREADIEAVCRLIKEHRLVTLTGSGGAGKTSLSVRIAEVLLPDFQDGVWQIELAPINDPSLIPSTIARALGMTLEGQPGSLFERLIEALKHRQMMLLLDNCEHLILDAAQTAGDLLQACPHLHILATSRERLGVPGEIRYRVPSLLFPDAGNPVNLDDGLLMQYDAVRLFVERVQSGDPTFVLSESSKPAVARICQRLDGIPLAIELAAARTNVLRVEQIAEKLEENLGLLSSSSRTVIPRHQTLRAAIDWSYSLLEDAEQAFLRRLSIFAGGFSLAAAQHVVRISDASPDDVQVLDLLSRLVDKSLVHVIPTEDPEPRYRILETVRQYLLEKLDEAGEREVIRKNHIAYYIQLVETAEPFLIRKEQLYWMRLLDHEHDNLGEAVYWAQGYAEAASVLRIAGALRVYMERRANWDEHVRWATSVVKLGTDLSRSQDRSLLAKALLCAGSLYMDGQSPKESIPFLEEALKLYSSLNDQTGIATTLFKTALYFYYDGNMGESERLCEKALQMFQEVNDDHGIGQSLHGLSMLASNEENAKKARFLAEQAVIKLEQAGDLYLMLAVLIFMAGALWYIGETALAKATAESYLPRSRIYGGSVLMNNLNFLALTAVACGDYEEAKSLVEEHYAIARAIGMRTWPVYAQSRLGEVFYLEGNLARAREILEEAIREGEMLDADCLPWQYCLLGNVALKEGSIEEAEALIEKCILEQSALNVRRDQYFTYLSRGYNAFAKGDFLKARSTFQQSLTMVRDRHMIPEVPARLEALAQVAAAKGELKRAVYLLAAASSLRDRLGTPLPPVEREGVRTCQEKAHQGLDPAVIQEAWRWATEQTVEAMIAVGLDEADLDMI